MLIPVVLSGGAGSRLWPVSREGNPKPFMKLAGGESLIARTYRRAAGLASSGEILTVTNRDYYFLSKDEFERCRLPSSVRASYLLEPMARNTAPAIAMAARYAVQSQGDEAVLLILAADHLIEDQGAFEHAVREAQILAEQNYLVTFGIQPTAPETGFGYIEAGAALGSGREVLRFVEKPVLEVAKDYVSSGRFYWNSGMFCFRAGVFLEALRHHAAEIATATEDCWAMMAAQAALGGAMLEIPLEGFKATPDLSIDYAVMEHASGVAMIEAGFDWNDIGSWSAIKGLYPADESSNRIHGEAILVDAKNTFIQAEGRVVAAVGTRDLMIVDTPDALLVADVERAQDVKEVVSQLKASDHNTYKLHRTVSRPWGTYTVLEEGSRFKIKRIEVRPGRSLSLQMHHHRSEHWVVVSGMARITNGDSEVFVRTNESTYIPAGQKHRLQNPGMVDLVIIEVQSGEYLGEDDILRFEDAYGRFTGEAG